MTCDPSYLTVAVQDALRREDLRGEWVDKYDPSCPVTGHCALATETLQALLYECGQTQWKARVAQDPEGGTHWWLTDGQNILDPTLEQYTHYDEEPPYDAGRPAGFQGTRWVDVGGTKVRKPSSAALSVLQRMRLAPARAIVERLQGRTASSTTYTSNKLFLAASKHLPKGWCYDHVGFVDGKTGDLVQMSGHRHEEGVFPMARLTDDEALATDDYDVVDLPGTVTFSDDPLGAENCVTFVVAVLEANGIHDWDIEHFHDIFKCEGEGQTKTAGRRREALPYKPKSLGSKIDKRKADEARQFLTNLYEELQSNEADLIGDCCLWELPQLRTFLYYLTNKWNETFSFVDPSEATSFKDMISGYNLYGQYPELSERIVRAYDKLVESAQESYDADLLHGNWGDLPATYNYDHGEGAFEQHVAPVLKKLTSIPTALTAYKKFIDNLVGDYEWAQHKSQQYWKGSEDPHPSGAEDLEVVWHATTAYPQIIKDGFKLRSQLESSGGLGGSMSLDWEKEGLSFTGNQEIAEAILESYWDMAELLQGDRTKETLLEFAHKLKVSDETIREYVRPLARMKSGESTTPRGAFDIVRHIIGQASAIGTYYDPLFMAEEGTIDTFMNMKPSDAGVVEAVIDTTNPDVHYLRSMDEWRVPLEAIVSYGPVGSQRTKLERVASRMDREEAVVIREDEEHWFKINAYHQGTPLGPAWFILWFTLPDRLKGRRSGYGRRYYELWESQLPPEVDLVYLVAINIAVPFWKAMGYEHVFEESASGFMIKSMKGHDLPLPLDIEYLDDFEPDTLGPEVNYVPDVSALKKVQANIHTGMAFPEGDTYGTTVYHGSKEPGLEYLEAGFPSYKGGVGDGAYVDFDSEIASFYGPYLYELKLLVHTDEIFYLEPYHIEELYGHSLLVGESVNPFWFEIDGDKYAVVGGSHDDDSQPLAYDSFLDKLRELLTNQEEWAKWFKYLPYDKVVAEDIWEQFTSALTKDEWGQPMADEDKVPSSDDVANNFDDAIWDRLESLDEEKVWHDVDTAMEAFMDEHLKRKNYGLSIDLDDIGAEVEHHGYKAVYVEGIRGGFPDSELLVFDPNDLRMVGEVVEDEKKQHRAGTDAMNNYLYHVSLLVRLDSIATSGLFPGRSENWPGYSGHAKGRVFLTEESAVSEWIHKVRYSTAIDSDYPVEEGFIPVVLRVPMEQIQEFLHEDELGSKDVISGKSFYVESTIHPEELEAYTPAGWIPVDQVNVEEMQEYAYDNAAKDYQLDVEEDPSGTEEEIVWLDEDVFNPFHSGGAAAAAASSSSSSSARREGSVDDYLYHTTSYDGLTSILESSEVRPGEFEGSPAFASFSEQPHRVPGDFSANDVTIVFKKDQLTSQLEKVEYTRDWFENNQYRAEYIAGEGWLSNWSPPDECYEYDEETGDEWEDEGCYEEARQEGAFESFYYKKDEGEWVSIEEGDPVSFSPEDIVQIIVHDPNHFERVQELLKGFSVVTASTRREGWGETTNVFMVHTCGRNSILPECEGAEGFSLLPTGNLPKTTKKKKSTKSSKKGKK